MKKLIIFISLVFFACERSSVDDMKGITDSEKQFNLAANHFAGGNYLDAFNAFNDALQLATNDNERSRANVGVAATTIRLANFNSGELNTAFQKIQIAKSQDLNNEEALAYSSILNFAFLQDFDVAITEANALLERNALFQSRIDPKFNSNDIIISLALSHFQNENYSQAVAAIQRFPAESTFSPNLSTLEGIFELSQKIETLILANN